jgi:MFS family permease
MSRKDPRTLLDEYIARVDRLPTWGLSNSILWAIGFSYFITLYDAVGNLGTALPYVPFLNPQLQSLIVAAGLLSYIPGAIILGYLADILGRRNLLIFTIILTAIGSTGMAISNDFITLLIFRIIEGAGIGGDLVLTAVYITELAPAVKRGVYMNWIFIAGWIAVGGGATLTGILVTSISNIGWRISFGIAALLAVAALILRLNAPESIRFLILKLGRVLEAEKLVRHMEEISIMKLGLTQLPQPKVMSYEPDLRNPLKILFKSIYIKRFVGILIFWITLYLIQYTFSGVIGSFAQAMGVTGEAFVRLTLLTSYSALGATTMAFLMLLFIDKVDRRLLITIGSLGWLLGISISIYLFLQQSYFAMFIAQFFMNFLGGGLCYLAGYLLTAESFPTNARATGFALTDGLGHLGGGLGPILLFPLISKVGPLYAWIILAIPVVIGSSLLWLLAPKTVGLRLEGTNEAKESLVSSGVRSK